MEEMHAHCAYSWTFALDYNKVVVRQGHTVVL